MSTAFQIEQRTRTQSTAKSRSILFPIARMSAWGISGMMIALLAPGRFYSIATQGGIPQISVAVELAAITIVLYALARAFTSIVDEVENLAK